MRVPDFVTAGMVRPGEQSALYRAQVLAQRVRDRYRDVLGMIPWQLTTRLTSLCNLYTFQGLRTDSVAGLARRIRRLRNDFLSLIVQ